MADLRLSDDMRRWQRLRMLAVVLGVAGALAFALAKLWMGDAARQDWALAAAFAGLATGGPALAIGVWSRREGRRLLARQAADLEREAANVRAAAGKGGNPLATAPDHGPETDLRFVDPKGRKAMRRRTWLFFGLAFLFLALAEYQWSERGDAVTAAIYAAFGLGSLVWALFVQQRLKLAR